MGYSAIAGVAKHGYSRLKGLFRRGINYSQYENIVSTAQNTVIGNLPKDLLNLVIKTSNPTNRTIAIKSLQSAFDDIAVNLSKIDSAEITAIKRFKPSSDNVVKIFNCKPNELPYIDEIFKRDLTKITMEAEKKLLKKNVSIF